MPFKFQFCPLESPLVQSGWQTRSGQVQDFMATATMHSELVFTRQRGKWRVTLVGPATRAFRSNVPLDAEFLGIPLAAGAYFAALPPGLAVNGGIELPLASDRAFWLNGSAIPIPEVHELETFAHRLTRRGELCRPPEVLRVLNGEAAETSLRTLQRQFRHAVGLSFREFRQIGRAQEAARQLQAGQPIADVVVLCGYSDQPHLTRALRRYWGQTPAQVLGARQAVVSVQDGPGRSP